MSQVLIWLLKFYQRILSPWLGARCRFYPSCSSYAIIAIDRFGAVKGSWLAGRRVCRCHPLNPGGFDYVPEK